MNLERRAADFTRHSPFKSPSGGSGWWWFKSTRVVEYQSPLLFPMHSDTIILCSRTPSSPLLLSFSSLIVVITATVAVSSSFLLPPPMRDVFSVSWLRRFPDVGISLLEHELLERALSGSVLLYITIAFEHKKKNTSREPPRNEHARLRVLGTGALPRNVHLAAVRCGVKLHFDTRPTSWRLSRDRDLRARLTAPRNSGSNRV